MDNAATSRYKPRIVYRAVTDALKNSANPGRGSHDAAMFAGCTVETCRNTVKTITGEGNVVFTKNCTEAINIALKGLNLSGNAVTSVFEHNAIIRTLNTIGKKSGLGIRYATPASGNIITLKEITKLINKDTSIVCIAEMSNVTGSIHEWMEIASHLKKIGIPLLLDTAQSLGHTDACYDDVSIIAASGHKGLHAPQGTGFLYFKEDISLNPLITGGTGTDGSNLYQPLVVPEGFESGTLNTPGISGLNAGIIWTEKIKSGLIKRINEMSAFIRKEISNIPGIQLYTDNDNGVISFNIGNRQSADVSAILNTEYGIYSRAGLHCAPYAHKYLGTLNRGAVRISLGYNNTPRECCALVEALRIIAHL